MKLINFEAIDGIKLNGILYQGEDKSTDIILAVHGMSGNCFKQRDEAIAKAANSNGVDYFCFNNRGSELVKYIRKSVNGKIVKELGGTSYEDVLEGYQDIIGAILKLQSIGYTNIYLQGHSLGCTKVVYTYNRLKTEQNMDLLSDIKGVILLSLIDIPGVLKVFLKDNYNKYLDLAEEKMQNNQELDLMPADCFIHPISVKSFLRYAKNNEDIDFINPMQDNKLTKINNISVPLFMRYGDKNEMILKPASEYVEILNSIIKNESKDINYIPDADHGYNGKEDRLAKEIMDFIKENKLEVLKQKQ